MEWKYPLMGIVETVTDVPCSIDKDMKKSQSGIENARGSPGILSEMVKHSVNLNPFQRGREEGVLNFVPNVKRGGGLDRTSTLREELLEKRG